jgi:replication initiation and membrane attachment protein
LKDILAGRKKLEAIGLLKTYRQDNENNREYLYELQVPLSPKDFFTDGFLSIYLFNRLGKTRFHEIKSSFLVPQKDPASYAEVTASFSEVYTSLHPSEMSSKSYSEITEVPDGTSEKVLVDNGVKGRVRLGDETFDFDAMVTHISTFIVPKEVLTPQLKDSIYKLAYIYQLEPIDMSRQIQNVYYSNGEITVEHLRREIQKWYRFEHEEGLPVLALRTQPSTLKAMHGMEARTEEEKAVKFFEEVSPYRLLEDYSGATPAEVDLKLVAYCMIDQNLTPGVTNVLLDYVLHTNDMKLAKGLVERIASHWARKKVQTVPEAMALARDEKRKYKEWQEKKNAAPGYYAGKPQSQVRVPDWLKPEETNSPNDNEEDLEENRKWLESLLNKSK